MYSRPYDVPQSWGKTYGEHKLFLEFSEESYIELKRYAEEEIGVIFSASGFDYNAIEFLAHINIPFFKVPSPDVGNLDFIEFMAKKHIPMVISSGTSEVLSIILLHVDSLILKRIVSGKNKSCEELFSTVF